MNLLMLSPHLPNPSWGAGTRSYHLLKALAREHAVSLVALTPDTYDGTQDAVLTELKLKHFVKVPLSDSVQRKRVQQVLSVLRGRSRLLDTYHVEAVQQVIDDLFARNH